MKRVPGRLRVKLATLLDAGLAEWIKTERPGCSRITVRAEDLHPMEGWQRSNTSAANDSFRWSGCGRFSGSDNAAASFDSFDTMTDCVRYGVSLVAHDALRFDVYAKKAL